MFDLDFSDDGLTGEIFLANIVHSKLYPEYFKELSRKLSDNLL